MCVALAAGFVSIQNAVLSFFIRNCLFLQATCFHFRTLFTEIDDLVSDKVGVNQTTIKEKLVDVIKLRKKVER